ncbi:MAG: phosphate ABC transporter ATP-binding protein [Nitriliruptorales bacterium]|nr:phosphate ABC transporter ATP-binding protein [Nitriliruptorales bacterium]
MDQAPAPATPQAKTQAGTQRAGRAEARSLRPRTVVEQYVHPVDDAVFKLEDVAVYYGRSAAVREISFDVPRNQITAIIGPSGSGKSTLLRSLNRMNDLIATSRTTGTITYNGEDLYGDGVDPVEVRRRIGMVFQKPNPFPKSIYDNVAFGPRLNGYKGNMDQLVEQSLRDAALWDEVKNKLKDSGLSLSGGQQQRLCIARAIAVQPDVILMDEPASALDPIATLAIEDLMRSLKEHYTILIVTHNMQQAARCSDMTAFISVDVNDEKGERTGVLVEFNDTVKVFSDPADPRTEDYVSGRFG